MSRCGIPGSFAKVSDFTPRANPQVVLTEMRDGTAVLLNLDTKFYFTLNASGVFVWKLIAAGGDWTAATLGERLTREFDVAYDVALADVDGLLTELRAEKLVVART